MRDYTYRRNPSRVAPSISTEILLGGVLLPKDEDEAVRVL